MLVLPCEPVRASTVTSGSRSTHVPGQQPERDDRVVDHDGGHAGRPGAEHRGGAGGDRAVGVVVAVDVLARDRDEEAARLDGAGCRRTPARSPVGGRPWRRVAADDVGDLRQGHRDHRGRSSSSRTHVAVVERVHHAGDLLARSRGPCRRPATMSPGPARPTRGADRRAAVADLDAPRRAPPRGAGQHARRGSRPGPRCAGCRR